MIGGSGASSTSLSSAIMPVIIGQFICWGWWVFGAGAFFCIPLRGADILPRVCSAFLAVLLDSRSLASFWLSKFHFQMVVSVGFTLKLHPPPLSLSHHDPVGVKPNLIHVLLTESLLSVWVSIRPSSISDCSRLIGWHVMMRLSSFMLLTGK